MRTSGRLDPRNWSRFTIALVIIAIAGFGIRLTFIEFGTRQTLWGDAVFYDLGATTLADGGGYSNPVRFLYEITDEIPTADGGTNVVVTRPGTKMPSALHPPAFVTVLGFESWLGLRSVRQHQYLLALIGTASIVLAGLLGRSLRGGRVGIIAAAITAVYANIWINDGLVMTETLGIFCVLLMSLLALRFWRGPTIGNAALFAVACGFGALTRVELALYLPIIAIAWFIRSKSSVTSRLVNLALMALIASAVVSPWVIRNLVVFNDTVTLSDGSGITLSQSNCDLTYHGEWLGTWRGECSGPQVYGADGTLLDESEVSTVLTERAQTYIEANTGRLITAVVPARIGRLWGVFRPMQTVRIEIDEWRPAFVSWLGFGQYLLLAPLALIGAFIHWRRKGPWLVLGAWPIIVTITAATAFGNIRYRTTAEPAVVVFAAIAIDAIVVLVAARHSRSHSAETSIDASPSTTASTTPSTAP